MSNSHIIVFLCGLWSSPITGEGLQKLECRELHENWVPCCAPWGQVKGICAWGKGDIVSRDRACTFRIGREIAFVAVGGKVCSYTASIHYENSSDAEESKIASRSRSAGKGGERAQRDVQVNVGSGV